MADPTHRRRAGRLMTLTSPPKQVEQVWSVILVVLAIAAVVAATVAIRASVTAAPPEVRIPAGMPQAGSAHLFQAGLAENVWIFCGIASVLLALAGGSAWLGARRLFLPLAGVAEVFMAALIALAYEVWQQANSCIGTKFDPCPVSLTATGEDVGTSFMFLSAASVCCALAFILDLLTLAELSPYKRYIEQTEPPR